MTTFLNNDNASLRMSTAISHAVGVHLSGSNTPRTAAVVVSGDISRGTLQVLEIYDRVGSRGMLFSDERLTDIVCASKPVHAIGVDTPLTVPPCVACERPVCPGVVACEDVEVGAMLSLTEQLKSNMQRRKKRAINPQSQRLWELYANQSEKELHADPSFQANNIPLIMRARTWQRRLLAHPELPKLRECSLHFGLLALLRDRGLDPQWAKDYRGFESGLDIRSEIIATMVQSGIVEFANQSRSFNSSQMDSTEKKSLCSRSVDIFNAMLCAVFVEMDQRGFSSNLLPVAGPAVPDFSKLA